MYRDWKAEAWFTLRFETTPDITCDICRKPFAVEDLAYTISEYESQSYAHVSCADAMTRCACCGGHGGHRTRPARAFSIISGWGDGGWRKCAACDGRGANPDGLPCWAPGIPP